MTRVETFREQASILRTLAKSFELPTLRGDLIALAKRCEALAEEAEREATQQTSQPTGRS